MREQQKYTAGIYCRLSSEDSAEHESMSIANQREMLCDYVKRQGWEIGSIYVDDGYSGVNFQRPDFQRMIADIEAGKINLEICKICRGWAETTYSADSTPKSIFLSAVLGLSP